MEPLTCAVLAGVKSGVVSDTIGSDITEKVTSANVGRKEEKAEIDSFIAIDIA